MAGTGLCLQQPKDTIASAHLWPIDDAFQKQTNLTAYIFSGSDSGKTKIKSMKLMKTKQLTKLNPKRQWVPDTIIATSLLPAVG